MTCQWIRNTDFGLDECGAPALYEEAGSQLRYCQVHADRLLNAGFALVPAEGDRAPKVEAIHKEGLLVLQRSFSPTGRTGELS